MILTLQQNVPMGPIVHFDGVITIYVRQYGTGNLRLGMNREDLVQGINLAPGAIVDGIPQAAANGIQQYFWSGDLWLISDQSGPVMVIAPAYSLQIDRLQGKRGLPADDYIPDDGGLATYR
jgi:hypothetical protein